MSSQSFSRAQLLEALDREGREVGTASLVFHQAVAERLGLNATDHKCADLLARQGAMTAGELAEVTGLTTGAVTGIADRLQRAGFIRRRRDNRDRRKVILQPVMEKMERDLAPLFESCVQTLDTVYARYSDEQLALILDFLHRIRSSFHEETRKLQQLTSDAADD